MELIAGDWRGCSGRKIKVAMEDVWSNVRKVIEGSKAAANCEPKGELRD